MTFDTQSSVNQPLSYNPDKAYYQLANVHLNQVLIQQMKEIKLQFFNNLECKIIVYKNVGCRFKYFIMTID